MSKPKKSIIEVQGKTITVLSRPAADGNNNYEPYASCLT
jgi:hypothetical protein